MWSRTFPPIGWQWAGILSFNARAVFKIATGNVTYNSVKQPITNDIAWYTLAPVWKLQIIVLLLFLMRGRLDNFCCHAVQKIDVFFRGLEKGRAAEIGTLRRDEIEEKHFQCVTEYPYQLREAFSTLQQRSKVNSTRDNNSLSSFLRIVFQES